MANVKTRHDFLKEAHAEELLAELKRRRLESLRDCSDAEIEEALQRRGVELPYLWDQPPKLVEK